MVKDNHVENYLKEILVFVYYGSIENNQPKNEVLVRKKSTNQFDSFYAYTQGTH